jgi:membrane protease YdiL (CAAX protease family)
VSDLQQNPDPITSEELAPPEDKIVILPSDVASVAVEPVIVITAPDVAAPVQIAPLPRDPAWTGWDVLAILMVGAVSFFTLLFLLVISFPGHSIQDKANRVASRPDLALGLQVVVYLIVLGCMYIVVMARTGGAPFLKSIHWNWPTTLWPYLLTGLALQAVVVTMEQFLPLPKDTPFDALLKNPKTVLLIAAFAVTLGPLMEELFFRAFLYSVLARRVGVIAAIAITALGFAGVHASQYANSPTLISLLFLVGLVIGWVRAKKNSVAAGLLVHVAYNGIVVFALVAAKMTGNLEKLAR